MDLLLPPPYILYLTLFLLPPIPPPSLLSHFARPLAGILPLVGRLSRPLPFRTRLAASEDKYNIPLLNLSDSQPASVPMYTSLYYFNSILLLIILSVTSASTPSTIATPYTPPHNLAPFAATTAASVLTPEQ